MRLRSEGDKRTKVKVSRQDQNRADKRQKRKVAVRQAESEEWPHHSSETLQSTFSGVTEDLLTQTWVTRYKYLIWYNTPRLGWTQPIETPCRDNGRRVRWCTCEYSRVTRHMVKSISSCANTHIEIEAQTRPDPWLKVPESFLVWPRPRTMYKSQIAYLSLWISYKYLKLVRRVCVVGATHCILIYFFQETHEF